MALSALLLRILTTPTVSPDRSSFSVQRLGSMSNVSQTCPNLWCGAPRSCQLHWDIIRDVGFKGRRIGGKHRYVMSDYGPEETCQPSPTMSAVGGEAEKIGSS